jgi:RNA polymerase sigma-70 factor (ECF subfamily)
MSDSEFVTRASLLVRLRDVADSASWQTFVDTYGPLLHHYCRRRGLQDADAADVAQETLLEVVRAIRTFEYQPDVGRFRDWLGTLVFRRLARFYERQGRRETPVGGDVATEGLRQMPAPAADPEWNDEFNAQLLRVALERVQPHFEPMTWRAFERVWLESRPAAEVARELGTPIHRVYRAKSRILKRLEDEIRTLAEDTPLLGAGPKGR